jgi:integrase
MGGVTVERGRLVTGSGAMARLSAQMGASMCRKSAILLSGIMSAAVRDQRISRNLCAGVSLPRLPDHRQRFVTMAELQDLADHAGAYRLMILVLGLCGLRFGECAALRVRSVDLMRRRLRVSESVSEVNGHMIWSTPKTHQSRDVPIPRSLVDALVAQAAGKKPEDVLFSSPNGEPIRLANWRQRVCDPAVAAAGLTGLTPHDLRHTAASLAIASGASVKHVQRMLGHKDAAMTLNVYASLFETTWTTSPTALTRLFWKLLRPVCGLNPRRRSSNCLSELPGQLPD